ncbi:BTA121 domain-containing protein surface lipoprotein [Borrelia persica]|uniref:BTA121 domain-containing protein surface lipoprotein n=1 Tax=Borrelia persica TaxID=44448 RepID=UPI000466878E|nr:CRASP family complement regulator-acquiring lipoprotein [Borrelia persica]
MKLIYYSLILLIIVSIVLLNCKPQSSLPVGAHSGGLPERGMGTEGKSSIDKLLDTFDLSDEQKKAAEYLRKALVDDAKTYSNIIFHKFLSDLGSDRVKTIVENMLEKHNLRLFYQAIETIKHIEDSDVKKALEDRLVRADGEYSLALKDYSDISHSVADRYNNILGNDKKAGFAFKGISKDTEVAELIHGLHNVANAAEIIRIFKAHSDSEPDDMYGMQGVFRSIGRFTSSSKLRGLIYLAFDYKREDLKFFDKFFYRYILLFKKDTYAYEMTNLKNLIDVLKKLERFSQSYYLTSFKNLREKEANLDKLELEDLRTLKQQFVLLEGEKQKLVEIKNQIIADYNADVSRIKTVVSKDDFSQELDDDLKKVLNDYLTDKTRGYEAILNNVVRKVEKANDVIIAILNKI